MTNYMQRDEATESLMLENNEQISEQNEIMELQRQFEKEYERDWKLIPADQVEERMVKLKTLISWGIKLFSVYREPVDLRLMINDYLEDTQSKNEVPSIPWMLVHLNLSKKQMKELLDIWDSYTHVLNMGMLKIESLLVSKWLKKEVDSKTLWLVLKNYHWLSERVEEVKTERHEHTISVIVKPPITWEVDDRIIEVE
jgi:hypothetical protein